MTIPPPITRAQKRLLKAALDQPKPSPALVDALNQFLTITRHPLALDTRREVAA